MTTRRLPVPPGRPRTEVVLLGTKSLLAVSAWAGCATGIGTLPLPQWAATATSVLVGACLGLFLFITWFIEAPHRIEHARRWRDDPDYRKQWGQGL